MKIPRRLRYLLAVFLLVVVAAAILLYAFPRARLSEAVFNQIQVGMSLGDVEKLVNAAASPCSGGIGSFSEVMWRQQGEAAGLVVAAGNSLPLSSTSDSTPSPNTKCYFWRSPNRALMVAVDDKSTVTKVLYARLKTDPGTWLARCKYWIDCCLEERE